MAVEFEFIHRDDNKRYAHDKSLPLVDFVMDHSEFLPHLCDFITSYTEDGCLDRCNERGINVFKQAINSLDFDNEENFEFINEFESIFREAYTIEPQKTDVTLGDIRGKVLENILEKLIRPRYTSDRSNPFGKKFDTGCEVILNRKSLTIKDRKTVAIAAWDGINGEFYEAKVGPHRFSKSELLLLTLIKNEVDKLNLSTVVACVSMRRVDVTIGYITQLVNNDNIKYNDNIKVYGKDTLLALKKCPIEPIA